MYTWYDPRKPANPLGEYNQSTSHCVDEHEHVEVAYGAEV